jgi:hypothetical protein
MQVVIWELEGHVSSTACIVSVLLSWTAYVQLGSVHTAVLFFQTDLQSAVCFLVLIALWRRTFVSATLPHLKDSSSSFQANGTVAANLCTWNLALPLLSKE